MLTKTFNSECYPNISFEMVNYITSFTSKHIFVHENIKNIRPNKVINYFLEIFYKNFIKYLISIKNLKKCFSFFFYS